MLKVFISGIQRQSGKTLVTAGLAATMQSLSYTTCVYKPIQTGANVLNGFKSSPDLALIKNFDPNIDVQSSYILSGQESPFVSSYEDGLKMDLNVIYSQFLEIQRFTDCVIVEGSNSISTPIAENITESDIVKEMNIPLILVVNPQKTTIDFAISALKYIYSQNINLLGVILNRHNTESLNLEEKYYPQILKEVAGCKILGSIPDYQEVSLLVAETLIQDVLNNLKIEEIFGIEIAKLKQ